MAGYKYYQNWDVLGVETDISIYICIE